MATSLPDIVDHLEPHIFYLLQWDFGGSEHRLNHRGIAAICLYLFQRKQDLEPIVFARVIFVSA